MHIKLISYDTVLILDENRKQAHIRLPAASSVECWASEGQDIKH